jgi:hypothetical protein
MDGTDINSCDRSRSRQFVATADDFGRVSLMNYPAVVQQAPAKMWVCSLTKVFVVTSSGLSGGHTILGTSV